MLFKLSIVLTSGIIIPVYNEVTSDDIDFYVSLWKKNLHTDEDIVFESSTFLASSIQGFIYDSI